MTGAAGRVSKSRPPKITAKKYLGDDLASWAVFIDDIPMVTGLTRREVPYYKEQARLVVERRNN